MAAGQDVGKAVLRCVAASSGVRLAPGSLIGLVESGPLDPQQWSTSSLHYIRSTPIAAAAEEMGYTPETINRGLVTLVYAPGQANLQVMDAYGEWQEVGALAEDKVLVMPGHALAYALCGLLPAAKHRMLAPVAGEPTCLSMTFELSPAVAAHIDFREALDAAGHALLARRYPPRIGKDLMSWFLHTYPPRNHRAKGAGVQSAPASAASRLVSSTPQLPSTPSPTHGTPVPAYSPSTDGSVAATQVDSPGTADNAGVPGKEHTSVVPSGGQEAVCADEMVELNVKTLAGRVDSLTVSRRATFASILLAYLKLTGLPKGQVRLIFAGRYPNENRTPADYGLESGNILYATIRRSGC